jgi:Cu2+-exporting ATPase
MTQKYSVYGMSCNNCRRHVEDALRKVEGVENVTVDLAAAEAIIEMNSHISLKNFQDALEQEGGNYGISAQGDVKYAAKFNKKKAESKKSTGSGIFYGPMRCEGDKT